MKSPAFSVVNPSEPNDTFVLNKKVGFVVVVILGIGYSTNTPTNALFFFIISTQTKKRGGVNCFLTN